MCKAEVEMVKERIRIMREIRYLKDMQAKWKGNHRFDRIQGRIDYLHRDLQYYILY